MVWIYFRRQLGLFNPSADLQDSADLCPQVGQCQRTREELPPADSCADGQATGQTASRRPCQPYHQEQRPNGVRACGAGKLVLTHFLRNWEGQDL